MSEDYRVVVASGTLRDTIEPTMTVAHAWTTEGVAIEAAFTGAHLLHLAAAACVLNDVHREAQARSVDVAGVRVTASGRFDPSTWASTGISYGVKIASSAGREDLEALVAAVDAVAEIPRALRAGTTVERVSE